MGIDKKVLQLKKRLVACSDQKFCDVSMCVRTYNTVTTYVAT